jgi:NitT/TauT family transport system substrate-binding protein
MDEIITMIRRHIPEHTPESIRASLDSDLNAINYRHLNVDKEGMRQIMQLSVEAGMIHEGVDLDAFADETFATDLTNQDLQAPVQTHSPGD